jgi:mono/diheme cytochrome c family protein
LLRRVPGGRTLQLTLLLASAAGVGLSPARGAAAPSGGAEAAALYRRHCQSCHGADGTGRTGAVDGLPNFTRAAWQEQRSDPELLVSILEGKGTVMPAFTDRLSEAQAQSLVDYIRAFSPTGPRAKGRSAGTRSADAFAREFRQLQNEYDELDRQLRELPSASQPRRRPAAATAEAPQEAQGGVALYRQHCQRCHGPDGKGNPKSAAAADCPNFSRRAWQARRTDAQLLASILNGTEDGMPATRFRSRT